MSRNAVGIFNAPDAALAAVVRLRSAGFDELDLMSPIPLEGARAALGRKPSAIKRFTLFGAMLGAVAGFALAAGSSIGYPQPTGGRPLVAIPPFLIITYETAILFGILATTIGFFISARLPVLRERAYVTDAGIDKYVVAVACDQDQQLEQASKLLREHGAEEVRTVEPGVS